MLKHFLLTKKELMLMQKHLLLTISVGVNVADAEAFPLNYEGVNVDAEAFPPN